MLLIAAASAALLAWGISLHRHFRPAPIDLSRAEQQLLLQLARQQLEAVLSGQPEITVDAVVMTAGLRRIAACFVTLTREGVQRGCMIDSLYAHEPIYRNVLRNVLLAATGDERYPPVTVDELDHIQIEISILSRPKRLHFRDPEDLLKKLQPGTDGVILRTPSDFATYLPQIWRFHPKPDQFLSHLCEKAGSGSDCWKERPLPQIETYRTFHFSEDEPPR